MSSATGNLGGQLKVWGGGFAILSVAALSAAYMFAGDIGLVLIVAGGLAIVALMVAGIFMWRARVARARDKLIGKGLSGASGGVGKADRAAMVEATRREFEKGVRKFRDAGRNLYSTPWYLIVGEPGGGKTEAIRHSQVRFIPGLQDMLQGVGGTLNMNWWFTRDAIILDTAGRILVEDLEAGTGGEWDTFLAMLKTHRKDCPINGLLLIIPSDTLMTDTPAEIDRKASKIAAKFETLQQELGVRFPVFVIITKCDLIGGFNEFFENLNDTQANQMMGWSNPQPLNEEFEPRLVDEHLEQVRQKLIRRRMRRLIEPLRGEDGSTRRMDQVDALYSLPDNIKVLSPRLKQYLETVFVAGTWSQKPLFLRGIYFSSSLQKGSPLDLDLAAALGISVKDLPREEERDDKRTFFLRDLFMEKVFAEKGLVTRVVNVDALQRKRKLVMLGGGIAATLLFLGLTWYQFQQLNHVLTAHVNFWAAASKNYDTKAHEYKIVESSGKYNGAQELEGGTIPELLERSKELVEPGRDVRIPAMFRMWARLGEGINEQRVKGHQKLVEAMVVSPVVSVARARMAAETEGDWESHPHEAKEALKELIRLEVAKATPPAEAGKGLNSLFQYVLKPDEYGRDYSKDRPKIEGVYKWTLTRVAGAGAVKGYPTAEGRGTPAAERAIAIGVTRYMGYIETMAERGSEGNLDALRKVRDALAAYKTAEDAVLMAPVREVPSDEAAYKRAAEQWRTQLSALREKATSLDAAVTHLSKQLNWDGAANLAELHKSQVEVKLNKRVSELSELLAAIPGDAPSPMLTIRRMIEDEVGKVQGQIRLAGDAEKDPSGVQKQLATLQGPYLAQAQTFKDETVAAAGDTPRDRDHVYRVRLAMLNRVEARLTEAEKKPTLASLSKVIDRLKALDKDQEALNKRLTDAAAQTVAGAKDPGLANAQKVAQSVIDNLAMPIERCLVLKTALEQTTKPARDWETHAAALPQAKARDMLVPPVPMTVAATDKTRSFKPEYTPAVVREVAGMFRDVEPLLKDEAEKTFVTVARKDLSSSLEKARSSWQDYMTGYLLYWKTEVLRELDYAARSWDEYRAGVVGLRSAPVQDRLEDFGLQLAAALEAAGATKEMEEVKAAIFSMKRDGFVNQRKTAVTSWSGLSENGGQARKELLRVKADNFQDFLITTGDSFVQVYWRQLQYTGLALLEKAAREEIEKATANWATYQRFPLVRPEEMKPGEADLKPAELAAVRGMVRAIRGVENVGGGTDTLAVKDPPGGDQAIRDSLRKIRGGDINQDLKTWLDQSSPVLESLPVLADDRGANAQVMKVKAVWRSWREGGGERVPMHAPPPHLRVSQGGKVLPVVRDGKKEDSDPAVNLRAQSGEFSLLLPGEPITFDFGTFLGADAKAPEATVPYGRGGSWAVLWLLHQNPRETKRAADGKQWEVVVRTKVKGEDWYVTLFLEFDGDAASVKGKFLPPLSDWPKRTQQPPR